VIAPSPSMITSPTLTPPADSPVDDNPYSETVNKTLKYCLAFPSC